jgi:hypothetical protein
MYLLIESIIAQNPHVKNAIIFGRGRLSNGVLIEPESYEEMARMSVEAFRNLIWYFGRFLLFIRRPSDLIFVGRV